MPGTTPNLLLPYPTDTDPIDVAGDMQELAEAIDTWGDAIDNEWLRARNEVHTSFAHPGGNTPYMGVSTCGTTNLGPFTYPVRVTVWAIIISGYSQADVGLAARIVPLNTSPITASGVEKAPGGYFINQPLSLAWDVAVGQNAGFQTAVDWAQASTTGIGIYFQGQGVYHVQRTGP